MKRSAALTPLSHDHHQALALALRLRRAELVDEAAADFEQFWDEHGRAHFQIEEEVMLPIWAMWGDADPRHVSRVANEHLEIRKLALEIQSRPARLETVRQLGELLHAHVRYEERELFPLIEADLSEEALAVMAAAVEQAEASHGHRC